jgi:hypothetical protein
MARRKAFHIPACGPTIERKAGDQDGRAHGVRESAPAREERSTVAAKISTERAAGLEIILLREADNLRSAKPTELRSHCSLELGSESRSQDLVRTMSFAAYPGRDCQRGRSVPRVAALHIGDDPNH